MKPLSEARAHLYNALDCIRVGKPESARERTQEAVYILEDHDQVLVNAPTPDIRTCDTCGHLFGGVFCESCSRFIREESDHWIQRVPATPEAKQSGPSPDNS